MVNNIAVNPERVQELVKKGGLKPDTLRKRGKTLEDLGSFLAASHMLSLDKALTNLGLAGILMEFIERVSGWNPDKCHSSCDEILVFLITM